MLRRIAIVLALILVAGCAAQPAGTPPPRLVVFMAVDGLPQRQVVDYREQLAPDGLRRLLDRGAWFTDAHYGHAFTVTAAGHATMLTGAYPHRTGIIGNNWRDPATGELEYCTGDTSHTYIGHATKPLDGTSPKNLKAETLGDVLRRVSAGSKVIAISGKDRGAILPAGKSGIAYMYMEASGEFASSTYYMKDHPQWVKDWAARKPADRLLHAEWRPLLPDSAYARSLPDNQKWYAKGGSLPKRMGEGQDKPGPLLYRDLLRSPFGDRLTLDFARAAIAGEKLGADDAPDILSISLSSHDYVNHAYGAESRLSHDHVLQLDREFQAFFQHLDKVVGRDAYVLVLTADHGFMPAPEHSQLLGNGGGRHSGSQMLARMNEALSTRFGPGKWIKYTSARSFVLDQKLVAERKVNLRELREATRGLALAEPAIQVAYTRDEMESGSRKGQPFFEAMQRSWNRELSGDVDFALKPYWMMASSTSSTTHGSPHGYDTNIPILFYGPAWIKPGRVDVRVEEADVAPTLARLLRIPPPASAEGRPLPLP